MARLGMVPVWKYCKDFICAWLLTDLCVSWSPELPPQQSNDPTATWSSPSPSSRRPWPQSMQASSLTQMHSLPCTDAPPTQQKKRAATRQSTGTNKKTKTEDKSVKWNTLVHSGVLFPPEYEAHGVKMLYDGRPVELTPEQEEVARCPCACFHTLSPPCLVHLFSSAVSSVPNLSLAPDPAISHDRGQSVPRNGLSILAPELGSSQRASHSQPCHCRC